ncbi:MAG: riboflavin synthase [Chitinophagales bacterium]
MFTGIIEDMGTLIAADKKGANITFTIRSSISDQLHVDQSVSHDGVCLTVEMVSGDTHVVTAIAETLERSAIGAWEVGQQINLERCMVIGGRLDGHIVQGHVDTTARITEIQDEAGSARFTLQFDARYSKYLVEKGSVSINGISLTVASLSANEFSVAIIPYTLQHTNLQFLQIGDTVNMEWDIIGKYVERMMEGNEK